MAQKIDLEEKAEGEIFLQNGQPGSNKVKWTCSTNKKLWATIGTIGTCIFISLFLVLKFVNEEPPTEPHMTPPIAPPTEPPTETPTEIPTEIPTAPPTAPPTEPSDYDYNDYTDYETEQIGGVSREDADITKVCDYYISKIYRS